MQTTHVAEVDLNLLVALQRLFETGSVTAAARSMGLTQSAMSRVLGRLRATFGDPLFVRTAGGLAATPRAEALKPLLAEALARVDAVIAGPSRFDPRTSARQFTIATADYGLWVLKPMVAVLRREAPNVSLRFVAQTGDWEAPLASGEWDLCWAPRRKEASAAIIWNRLFTEEFAFVVRRGHPATRSRLTLDRFLQLDHVAIAPGGKPGNHVDETLARLGRQRRVAVTVLSFLVVPALVAASDVGAVLPRRIAASASELVTLDLPFALTGFEISQAWHERMRHDEGHAWFRQRLRALASTL
jgi:DNA-binding transcriptional LysR family regulator